MTILIKEAIGTGSSIEEALEDAKKQLGVDETTEIEYEVVQMPEKRSLVFSAEHLQR